MQLACRPLAYDQIDDENIDYMVSNDEHSEEQLFEEFRKFDPETANNYKNMFEVATRKVKMQALREGKLDIAKQMLRKGEPTDKIKEYTGLSIKEIGGLA